MPCLRSDAEHFHAAHSVPQSALHCLHRLLWRCPVPVFPKLTILIGISAPMVGRLRLPGQHALRRGPGGLGRIL